MLLILESWLKNCVIMLIEIWYRMLCLVYFLICFLKVCNCEFLLLVFMSVCLMFNLFWILVIFCWMYLWVWLRFWSLDRICVVVFIDLVLIRKWGVFGKNMMVVKKINIRGNCMLMGICYWILFDLEMWRLML